MKRATMALLTGFLLALGASAQIVLPPMPGKTTNIRPISPGTSGGLVSPSVGEAKARYTTHLVLAPLRQWTSTDGKTLEAKLLAFEDLVAETPKGAAQPSPPVAPANPTVVRDGKIRLMSDKKPFELALTRLSEADREFVEKIRIRHAKKTSAPNPS